MFDDFELGRRTCLVLEEEASARGFVLLAYCLMPDHLHMLAAGRDDSSSLVRFIQVFKQRTGYAYKQLTGCQLWQASYYDHVVRQDDEFGAIALYIFENPVAAGLVSHPRLYELAGGEYHRLVAEGAEARPEADRAKAPSLHSADRDSKDDHYDEPS
jgi:REP element-mobilizing transposase RayT